jgi:hypothetical protein
VMLRLRTVAAERFATVERLRTRAFSSRCNALSN